MHEWPMVGRAPVEVGDMLYYQCERDGIADALAEAARLGYEAGLRRGGYVDLANAYEMARGMAWQR